MNRRLLYLCLHRFQVTAIEVELSVPSITSSIYRTRSIDLDALPAQIYRDRSWITVSVSIDYESYLQDTFHY